MDDFFFFFYSIFFFFNCVYGWDRWLSNVNLYKINGIKFRQQQKKGQNGKEDTLHIYPFRNYLFFYSDISCYVWLIKLYLAV